LKSIETARYTLARIYDKQNLIEPAIEEFKETVKLNPNNYDAFYSLGRLYYKQQQFEKAEKEFESAVRIKGDFVNAYFFLAITQQRLQKIDRARQNYEKTLILDPNFISAYSNIGTLYKSQKDYKNAINAFNSASKIQNRAYYHYQIGDCYYELNQFDKALDSFFTAVSINPKSTDADKKELVSLFERISEIYGKKTDFSKSLEFANKGLEINPSSQTLWFLSAFAKSRTNDIDGSINDYIKTINLDPDNITSYLNLSQLYNEKGLYKDGASIAQRGIIKAPSEFKLYNNLANSLRMLESFDEAAAIYRKSISINASIPEVHFNLGVCLKKTGSYEGSIQPFKQAIILSRDYLDAYYELGESYFLMKNYTESKNIFNELLLKSPNYSKKDQIDKMFSAIES